MKNLFTGIIIGACLTLLGVWVYASLSAGKAETAGQGKPLKIAERGLGKAVSPANRNAGGFAENPAGKDPKKLEQRPDNRPHSSGNSLQDVLPENRSVSDAVQSFTGLMSEGRSSWQELAQEIRGLKEKGKEGLTELLKIIQGEGLNFFKMIAAGVLGEVYADTQDPEVKTALENRVLPLLQNILDGESDMRLKGQAVNTLGRLNIQKAQDMLVDILLDDTNQWMQLASMRVLRENGNLETASQLVEMLQSSPDLSQIMLAAGTLGKMNNHLNDPLISAVLQSSIPKLKMIIEDENQTFQTKRNALMTLGALGTSESVDSLIKIIEEQAGQDNGLERMAVWSLASNGTRETAEGLGRRLTESDNDDARVLFASAIGGMAGRHHDPTAQDLARTLALPALRDISRTGKSIDVQKRAIRAMGSVGTDQDIDFLRQLALSNADLQPTAFQAVRQIQNRESNQNHWSMGRVMRPF